MPPSTPTLLTTSSILEAAKAQVRRFGETKTNMVDIGRALGVSHAALYRLYRSKAAIMDAIVDEAMRDEAELAAVHIEADGPAADRLLAMLLDLHRRKRERFVEDREIHDLYRRILVDRPDMIAAYAERMTALIARLIIQAIESGEWKVDDVDIASGVVRDAVTAYIHPGLVAQLIMADAPIEEMLGATVKTVACAFQAGMSYRPTA